MTKETMHKKSWFLNQPFRLGMVYNQLVNMNYDYVVGMDIGHGESLVCLYIRKIVTMPDGTKADQSEVRRLQLNDNEETKIPTLIRFAGDKVIIGHKAKKSTGFIQDFKVRPAQWEDHFDEKRSYRDLLGAFIRKLWQQILENNKDWDLKQALEEGKLLIAVGCPSSPDWTTENPMQEYQKLISQVTGCSHVAVLPESTAAIMSALLDVNKKQSEESSREISAGAELSKGVAVVDAGSSTIDFTYVLLGKKLITQSLDVAGYWLDEMMLEQALQESFEKDGLTREQIPDEQLPDILIQLRELKETFYPDGKSLGYKPIDIWAKDETGKINKEIDSGKRLSMVINQKFMDAALTGQLIQRNKYDTPKSWKGHCEKFIRDCKARIGQDAQGNLLCDKVIITGGTSFVTALQQVVEAEFPGKVVFSPNPSLSVARGLCFGKSLEIQGCGSVEDYKKQTGKMAEDGYSSFVLDLADHLSDGVCEDIQEVVARYLESGETVTAGQLLDEINSCVRKNPKLTGEGCRKQVEEIFVQRFQSTQEKIYEKAMEVSRAIYGTHLDKVPELPRLTQQELAQMAKQLDISSMIGNTWINSIVSCINFSTLSTVLFFIGSGLLFTPLSAVGMVLVGMSLLTEMDSVQQQVIRFVVTNKTVISRGMMKKLAKSLTDPDERLKVLVRAGEKTAKTMKKTGLLKEEFLTCVNAQAEILLGKVLFLVYDEKPDMQ